MRGNYIMELAGMDRAAMRLKCASCRQDAVFKTIETIMSRNSSDISSACRYVCFSFPVEDMGSYRKVSVRSSLLRIKNWIILTILVFKCL